MYNMWHPSRVSNWAKQQLARDVNKKNKNNKNKLKKLKITKNGDWTIKKI